MSQTLTISDELYPRLKDEVCEKGLGGVEHYLE